MSIATDTAPPVTLVVPHTALSAARARGALAADLRRRGLPAPLIEDAVLVLSEILSNALRHARPLPDSDAVQLCWSVGSSGIEIEVSDGGSPTRPRTVDARRSATGGRGLDIVEALSVDWGVAEQEARTTVWARLGRCGGGRFGMRGAGRQVPGH